MQAPHPASPASEAAASTPKARSPSSTWAPFLLFLAAAGLGLLAWWVLAPKPPVHEETGGVLSVDANGVTLGERAPQWSYVQLAVAKLQPALPPLPAPGRVTTDERRSAAVGTPLAGRVEQVLVRVGDHVKAGAPLFSVRSAELAELTREEEGSLSEVTNKQRIVERTRALVALNATPEKELFAAEAELKQAELALKAARAKRTSARISPEGDTLFWVSAPRAGTVVESEVLANLAVTPDRGAPLMRISDLDEVLVLADMKEEDARGDLKVGSKVTIKIPGADDAGLPGTVEHVSEVVDPLRRAVEVRIRAPNTLRRLRPNAFVEVVFPEGDALERVRIASEAVVTDGARSVVFVGKEAGRLERVRVTAGRQRDGEIEVLSGLPAGATYVARGALLLQNQVELSE